MSKLDDVIAEIKAEDLSYDQLLEKCATLQIENDNQASTLLSLNSIVEDLQAKALREKQAAADAAKEQEREAEQTLTKTQQELADHEAQFKEAPTQI